MSRPINLTVDDDVSVSQLIAHDLPVDLIVSDHRMPHRYLETA